MWVADLLQQGLQFFSSLYPSTMGCNFVAPPIKKSVQEVSLRSTSSTSKPGLALILALVGRMQQMWCYAVPGLCLESRACFCSVSWPLLLFALTSLPKGQRPQAQSWGVPAEAIWNMGERDGYGQRNAQPGLTQINRTHQLTVNLRTVRMAGVLSLLVLRVVVSSILVATLG